NFPLFGKTIRHGWRIFYPNFHPIIAIPSNLGMKPGTTRRCMNCYGGTTQHFVSTNWPVISHPCWLRLILFMCGFMGRVISTRGIIPRKSFRNGQRTVFNGKEREKMYLSILIMMKRVLRLITQGSCQNGFDEAYRLLFLLQHVLLTNFLWKRAFLYGKHDTLI